MLEQEKVPDAESESLTLSMASMPQPAPSKPPNEIIGVVKARASTTTVRSDRLSCSFCSFQLHPAIVGYFVDVGGAPEEYVGQFGGHVQSGGYFETHKIYRTRAVLF